MKRIIIATLALLSLSLYANDQSIVPENDLWIPAGNKTLQGLTEEQFFNAIEAFENAFTENVASKGGILKVYKKWTDGTVNAYAKRSGRYWKIYMFGGLARHEVMTKDAYSLVICHELGHHMGGAPKLEGFSNWASIEGQSDYWATAKCLRKVWENDNNVAAIAGTTIPTIVEEKCNANFSLDNDRAICKRSALAGMVLGNVFQSLRQSPDVLSFSTPDPNVVAETSTTHPASQCRLDSYFAGAICDIDKDEEVEQENDQTGVCTRAKNYVDGVRPLCWFKPEEV